MVLIDPPSESSAADNPTIPPNRHIELLRPGWLLSPGRQASWVCGASKGRIPDRRLRDS